MNEKLFYSTLEYLILTGQYRISAVKIFVKWLLLLLSLATDLPLFVMNINICNSLLYHSLVLSLQQNSIYVGDAQYIGYQSDSFFSI